MTDEPRTIRELREAVRALEAGLERVQMAPAMALGNGWVAGWYVRKARLALRQAERGMAKSDDPRLPVLKPLSPQIGRRRVYVDSDGQPIPRRRRYRCPACFHETLRHAHPHEDLICHRRGCDTTVEPVARRRKAK